MRTANKNSGQLTLLSRLARAAGDPGSRAPPNWQRFSNGIRNFFARKLWRDWRSRRAKKCEWMHSRAYSLRRPRWQSAEPSAMMNRRHADCGRKPIRCGS